MRLSDFEQRWATVLASALAPPDALAAAGVDTRALDVGAAYALECARSPWQAALVLRLALWLAWLSPIWLSARPRTFGGVDEATRVQLLERLLAHRFYVVKMTALLLKMTLCSALLGDAGVLGQLGAYDLPRPLSRRRAS